LLVSPDDAAPVLEASFARTGNNDELVQDRMIAATKVPDTDPSSRSNDASAAT
jgi:hypothetical protein